MKEKRYRDVVAAVNRAGALKTSDAVKERLERLARAVDAKAAAGAAEFLPRIRQGQDQGKDWIDAFLAYRDDFEFAPAPAAREVMQAFDALRAEQDAPANKALEEARAAFGKDKPDDGYAKYQEIVDRYYAAACYRNVKRWLAERK